MKNKRKPSSLIHKQNKNVDKIIENIFPDSKNIF